MYTQEEAAEVSDACTVCLTFTSSELIQENTNQLHVFTCV